MRQRWALLTIVFLLMATAACDLEEFASSTRYQDDFHESHPFKVGGRLYVENFNGSIEITGEESSEVDISGTKYASTESTMQALKVDVIATGDSIRIRTIRPSGHHGNMGVRYFIRVPSKTLLERVTSSNGAIRVSGIETSARLETSNGSIEVDGPSGPLNARTSNGRIRADSVRGGIDAQTSNGSIRVSLSDVEQTRPVRLRTSNGSVELTAEDLANNDISASTSNGSITLRLPSSVSAEIRAETSNSSITNEFASEFRGRSGKRYLDGTIGSGGPLVTLTTSNGSIRLLRL